MAAVVNRSMRQVANERRQSAASFNLLRRTILLIVFIYLGISLGIPGVTLIYFEKLTASREDEVALIFSSRAVGSLAGWLLGLLSLDLDNFEPTTLMSLGTLGLFLTHLLLPWAVQLWWVLCGFTFQGALMAITIQGCLALVRKSRPKRLANASSSHQLVFACLFGCVVCPFIALPFLKGSSVISEHRGLNAFLDEQVLLLKSHPNTTTVASPLHTFPSDTVLRRQRRGVFFPNPVLSTTPIAQNKPHVSITTPTTPKTSIGVTRSYSINKQPINSSALEQALLNLPVKNSSGVLSNETTVTKIVNPTTVPVPKKPSVIDAKHLNQDASSADGSNTAVKMKQLGEERRIDTVAGVPPPGAAVPPPQVAVIPVSSPVPIASSSVNMSSTPNATDTSGSNSTKTPSSLGTKPTPGSHTTTPSSLKLPNGGAKLPDASLLHAKLTTVKITATRNTTHAAILSTANASSTPLRHRSPETATPTRPVPATSTPAPVTHHHRHIVEHHGNSNFASRFLFTHPLQPVQKVYCFLSVLGLFTWLLTITLTSWCQGTCGFRSVRSSNDRIRLRTRRSPSAAEDGRPLVSSRDSDDVLYDRWQATPTGASGTEVSNSEDSNSDDNSRYVSAQETVVCSDPESNEPVTSRAATRVQFADTRRPDRRRQPPGQWPRVSWPTDAWLLLAEFFSTGLETAFGGFIHGFTVRYLLWTPSLGFLANSLFWLGGFVGRLPSLLLLNAKARSERKSVRTSSPIPEVSSSRMNHRALIFNPPATSSISKAYWRLALIRIFGGLLCTFSAVSLTRFSLSSDRCSIGSSDWLTNFSPNYVTWLGGSLFLGLGVGIASSNTGTCTVDTMSSEDHEVVVHRLQLAGHIGQMLIPAAVGYVHHLAVFWHYACVLSSMALALGLLMTLTLVIDLVCKVCANRKRDSGVDDITLSAGLPGQSSLSAVKRPLSPVTLHGVSD